MSRVWEVKHILNGVYCNSSGDLFFGIILVNKGKRYRVDLNFSGYTRHDDRRRKGEGIISVDLPQYICCEIELSIIYKIEKGDFRVYEVDRFGDKRYKKLRYYDEREMESWREWLTKRVAQYA